MKGLQTRLKLALLIGIGMGLWQCGGQDLDVSEPLRPVRYTKVVSTGGGRARSFSGAAQSGVESNLSFKVAGTVEEIEVKVGDRVSRGELIARLDPKDFELKVQQAEAALVQTRAQLQRASSDYDRVRTLYENNNASKSDLDAARAAYESADANVASAEKALELAQLQLSYTRLTAPSSGNIAMVDVEESENVQSGRTIVMMTAGDNIEVEVAIPEVLISRIQEGDSVTVEFNAIPDRDYEAVVREVGVAATGFATTYPVTVRLIESDENIRSGMAAEVIFRFEQSGQEDRVLLPPIAVGEDQKGRFVFTVEPASGDTAVVRRNAVTTGELTADGLEILDGVRDGDLVVTAGVSKIRDGQKVRL